MAPTPAGPRHVPTQERAQWLVRAIREAALEILQEAGPEALTTHRIAERAGVSVGSLYYYFPNKEAVVTSVFDALFERYDQELDAIWSVPRPDDEPLEHWIAALVQTSFKQMQRVARLHQAFLREYSVNYDLDGRQSIRTQRRTDRAIRWLTRLLERDRDQLAIEDPARAARMAVTLLTGAMRSGVQGDVTPLDEPGFEREVVRALIAYLRLGATVQVGGA